MSTGSGYGKVILFGEHFVVYGLPAIASAIGSTTIASVNRLDEKGIHVIDDRPEIPGYKEKKKRDQVKSIENILKFCGIDTTYEGVEIKFMGDLVAASGIGASAASCTALAKALNDEFQLDFTIGKINAAAFEGEKGYHGNPSGIDNTASTYGGLIWFQKNSTEGQNSMEKLRMKEPTEIIIANTGITASTTNVVAEVQYKTEKYPKKFNKIFKNYSSIAIQAREALSDNNLERVGELMDENQELLRQIEVSSPELEDIITSTKKHGAIGAKLTGTGKGGNMIALTPGKKLQDRVYHTLSKKGYAVWKTLIGIN